MKLNRCSLWVKDKLYCNIGTLAFQYVVSAPNFSYFFFDTFHKSTQQSCHVHHRHSDTKATVNCITIYVLKSKLEKEINCGRYLNWNYAIRNVCTHYTLIKERQATIADHITNSYTLFKSKIVNIALM